jgi:peptidoglycan/xylan/chitin deacetylase (PgdA/CDA1 family)
MQRRSARHIVLSRLEWAAAALRLGEPSAICLGFHNIEDGASHLAFSPQLFRELIRKLAEDGWRGASVAEWSQQAAKPGKTVVITFDDGFRSVWTQARPILDEFGFHATVFVISSGIGRSTAWTVSGRPLPSMDLLSTPQLRELTRAGWEIGAHTRTHSYLPERRGSKLEAEIAGSRRDLEDLLGMQVDTFAYPYGGYSPEVVEAVATAGFQTAWTTRPAPLGRTSSPLLLPRYMVPPWASPAYAHAASGWLLPFLYSCSSQMDRVRGRPPSYARIEPGTDCTQFTDPPS